MPSLTLTTSSVNPTPNRRRRGHRRLPSPETCRSLLFSVPSPPTLRHYASLASRLARDGRLQDFLMLAETALASDVPSSHFVSRVNHRLVACGVAEVLRRGGGLEAVLEFLKGAEAIGIRPTMLMDGDGLEALAVECRRLVDEGRMVEFIEVMEILAGYQFQIKNIIDPKDILKIFVDKRDAVTAVRYASLHSHSQLLFCCIIEEFGKKKDLASALKAFECFKDKSGGFNMFACRIIIDTCGLCGDFLRSRDIFEELLSQKIIPNTFVFNSLMNVNAHDLNYTLYVYKHMQVLGVRADITSYNILLKACCLAKRVDLVQDIYKELKLIKSSTFQLDVITYSTMIKAFSDAKMLQMAVDIKEDMLLAGVHPNVVTWCTLIGAFANAGFVDQAMEVLRKMIFAGCEPNSYCFNKVLYACVMSFQYDRAFRLFNTWKVSGFEIFHIFEDESIRSRNDCQNSVTECLPSSVIDSNRSNCNLIKTVPFKPDVATYNILMKACGRDYFRAKHLMDEMKLMGLSPNHVSWSTLIDICGSTQNVTGAMQALKGMDDDGIKPDVIAYTAAIKACVGSKHSKTAFCLFEEMKRRRVQPNMVTYNTLLRARTKYGSSQEVQQCLAIYMDMRKAGFNSNDHYLKELLEEWCEGVLSSGNEQNAAVPSDCSREIRTDNFHVLFEKVADHLQRDIGESGAVDVRGFSKVEARIIVLSVLRMVKEKHCSGDPIKDDMIILTGKSKDTNRSTHHELEVQQTIISILQENLGLHVSLGTRSGPPDIRSSSMPSNPLSSYPIGLDRPNLTNIVSARRPEDLGIIRVSKESLRNWLQKKSKH